MKIIHEIGSRETLSATLGSDPYHPYDASKPYHWRAEILIVTKDIVTGADEPLYIEGSAGDIRATLRAVLDMIEGEEVRIQENRREKTAE